MKRIQFGLLLFTAVTAVLLSGCEAVGTEISHRQLQTETKMSQTIFLNPVAAKQKTILVQIRNTSSQSNFDIKNKIIAHLQQDGYRIVTDPAQAHYMLQANILSLGKLSPSAADKALLGGYGSGILTGAAIGATTGRGENAVIGGLVGGAVSGVANALVKDVTYTVITDVQVSERTGQAVAQTVRTDLQQGTSTDIKQRSSGSSQWLHYRTRIVSTANKADLKFAEAKPILEQQLAASIGGIF